MTREVTFQEEIQNKPIDLPRAALSFAREINYPELQIESYLDCLAQLADASRQVISVQPDPLSKARALAAYLFQQLGFRGNQDDYQDPRNSFLNDVLDRRCGIPISLSVVYMALADRLGIPAWGVGLPGHFIITIQYPENPIYLDPFHAGQELSIIDCARLVEHSTGYAGSFQPKWLAPVQPIDILARMLYNLRNVYIRTEQWIKALPVIEHLQMIQPGLPEHNRDLATINIQAGFATRAIEYYQRYLLQATDAEDAALVRRNLQEIIQKISRRN